MHYHAYTDDIFTELAYASAALEETQDSMGNRGDKRLETFYNAIAS
jgi:hypothetical protein